MKNFILLFIIGNVWAHEGHDHEAPGSLVPLRGGIIKHYNATNTVDGRKVTCYVEVAANKNQQKIYFFNAKKELVDGKSFQLSLTAAPSIDGKLAAPEAVTFASDKKNDKILVAGFDKKSANRYNFILKFTGPEFCKANEEITFIFN